MSEYPQTINHTPSIFDDNQTGKPFFKDQQQNHQSQNPENIKG